MSEFVKCKKPVIKISKDEAEAFDTLVSDKLKTMGIKAAIKDTDKEILEEIENMANTTTKTTSKKKIVQIKIDNYTDIKEISAKLAYAGLWVRMKEEEDWPSGTNRFLCIEVDDDICKIV